MTLKIKILFILFFTKLIIFSCKNDGPVKSAEQESEYSCPMHPGIRNTQKSNCPICGMELTLLKDHGFAQGADYIKVYRVFSELQAVSRQSFTGVFSAMEELSYKQFIHLPGRVEKLFLTYNGQYIKKGQKIASVYSKELIAVLEALKFNGNSESVIRAARNNLAEWKVSEAAIARINIDKDYRKPFEVYADHSGYVQGLAIGVGSHISSSHTVAPLPVFEIIDISKLLLKVKIPSSIEDHFRKGQSVKVFLHQFKGKNLPGIIRDIQPTDNPALAVCNIVVLNKNHQIKIGSIGMIHLEKEFQPDIKNELSIPSSAVLIGQEGNFVYLKKNNKFIHKKVEIIRSTKDKVYLMNTFVVGDEIVLDAAYQLFAEEQLFNSDEGLPNDGFSSFFDTVNVKYLSISFLESYFILRSELTNHNFELAKGTLLNLFPVHTDWSISWRDEINQSDSTSLRIVFSKLSEWIIQNKMNIQEEEAFIMHCPMAFDNQGAYWLSSKRLVENPYFGSQMLRCGQVKDSL